MLAARGVEVLDTDDVARALLAKGTDESNAVVDRFGPGILRLNGEIDRSLLGRIVFADEEAREDLNRLLHPEIRRRWVVWRDEQRTLGHPCAVVISLLFETGMDEGWDIIVCVSSPISVVRDRLAARGLGREEADQRIVAQWPLKEKERRSDIVINNNHSLEDLERQVQGLVARIGEKGATL